jgi:hypothetical protein
LSEWREKRQGIINNDSPIRLSWRGPGEERKPIPGLTFLVMVDTTPGRGKKHGIDKDN